MAWFTALSQPHMHFSRLTHGPTRADPCEEPWFLDGWGYLGTGLEGQSKVHDLYWFHQVHLSCSTLSLDAVLVWACLWNILCNKLGSPGSGNRLCEQLSPSVCSSRLSEKLEIFALPHLFTLCLLPDQHFWCDSQNCSPAQFYHSDLD